MMNKTTEQKFKASGLPSGQIDTSHAVSNAQGILERKHIELEIVVNKSLEVVHKHGYYTPYLNHRKISIFYINICSDSTPYDIITY